MPNFNNKNQKGIVIYLALTIMTILLAIGLGLNVILVRQIKIVKGKADSVFAFFAADTGMERELYENNPTGTITTSTLNGASYSVEVIATGTHHYCPRDVVNCVLSTGRYQNTYREILMPR